MTMPSSVVLTIILNYKTAEMSLRSAEAALGAMEGIEGEIILVDNDSQDGSFEKMCTHVTSRGWDKNNRVRVLQSGHNGGYGSGNNVGIRAKLSSGQTPDYIYVLNSDAFPEKEAIRILRDHLDTHPKTGFVGSYIHGEDDDPHLTSFRFPSIASEFESAIRFGPVTRILAHHVVPIPIPDHSRPVDWLAGASLMMRQNLLDEIGLFDETFFLYFEETDLCRRAAQAGYQTHYLRDSRVMHIGSVSTGMKSWSRVPTYWFDSRLHYFTKNHGALYAAGATLAHLSGGLLHWLRCLITRKNRDVPPFFLTTLAWHDLRAGLYACLPNNRRERRHNPIPGE